MSEYIHSSHQVTVFLCHLVFLAKYQRAVYDKQIDAVLRDVYLEIEKRHEIKFVEIGVDRGHVHILV
jgi:putative transposase